MLDPLIAAQLDATRARWVERPTDPNWHEWLARTSRSAFRGLAMPMTGMRIHSLPGSFWEVLCDSGGAHWLVADDELTASLAELRALSSAGARSESGYDKSVLLLADAFRRVGDPRRYTACMGWALPRAPQLRALRRAAFAAGASSAEAMVVLLHELAHRVLAHDDGRLRPWREICVTGVDKLVEALTAGELRRRAVANGVALGLEESQASLQIQTYLEAVRSNSELLEELACDLLAAIGLLNLRSSADVFGDPEAGPDSMTTKEVGDALFVAHGAIQNMGLIAAVHIIGASASRPIALSRTVPDRVTSELTARSTALVFLLSNLLRSWCSTGRLRDAWAVRIAAGEPAFQRGVAHRNQIRATAILAPLEELDGVLHDEERFAEFERRALGNLRGFIEIGPSLIGLDAARWSLTMAPATSP